MSAVYQAEKNKIYRLFFDIDKVIKYQQNLIFCRNQNGILMFTKNKGFVYVIDQLFLSTSEKMIDQVVHFCRNQN